MKNLSEIFSKYFHKNGNIFCNNLSLIIPAILRSGTANTALIAKEMSKFNGKDFHTNDIHLARFLQSDKFQIDDSFWRSHNNMLFDFMIAQKLINNSDPIQINIDFTSNEDHFLILSASVIINNKATMLYFTTRLYPKTKDKLNLKKMEEAFLKGLRHVLSNQYRYIIVADRGFGNNRFARFCRENNFEYVLRVASNRKIKIDGKKEIKKLQDFDQTNQSNLKVFVEAWKENATFEITTREGSTWFLLNGTRDLNAVDLYEKRFKIEKLFQDIKSSGFDIEKTKIRKYTRFRRLLYCISIAHMFIVMLGNFLETQTNDIKKNSALHIETLLAFLNWDLERFPHSLINQSKSFVEFC